MQSSTGTDEGLASEQIEAKINQRLQAKLDKDWGLADQIRDELKQQGVILEDAGKETTWRRA
ncbi:MAG: hypothetical protein RPR28_09970 [Cycloclasticus sp.]